MPYFSYLDEYSDITDITFRDRKRFAPLDKLSHSLMRGHSGLSISDRETIAAFVSGLNACSFCYGIHTQVATDFGVSESLLDDLLNDIDKADVSPEFTTLLKYVRKLTLTPARLSKEDAEAVYDAGWSEDELYDAICVCSLFSFYNRLLDGHGIKGNDNIYRLGADHLSKRGYSVPWFIKYLRNFIRSNRRKQLQKRQEKIIE